MRKGPKLLRAELGHFCTHITSLLFEFKRPNMAAGGKILLLYADANDQQVNEVYFKFHRYDNDHTPLIRLTYLMWLK